MATATESSTNMKNSHSNERLTAIYDMRYAPATFDFGTFLIIADCIRQIRNYGGMTVNILSHEFRSKTPRDVATSRAEKLWRISNIFQGVSSLLPSIKEFNINQDPPQKFDGNLFPYEWQPGYKEGYIVPYLARYVLDLYREGANPNVLRASEMALTTINNLYGNNYITFTLRNSRQQDDRNTNLDEWYRFYQYIQAAGIQVVVIPDQEDLFTDKKFAAYPWQVFESAAINLDLRFALYENAMSNFCTSNGPCSLLFYSNCSVYQFDQLKGNNTQREFWTRNLGFEPGGNYPWCRKDQVMTWQPSEFKLLCQYFDACKEQAA